MSTRDRLSRLTADLLAPVEAAATAAVAEVVQDSAAASEPVGDMAAAVAASAGDATRPGASGLPPAQAAESPPVETRFPGVLLLPDVCALQSLPRERHFALALPYQRRNRFARSRRWLQSACLG